MTIGIVSAAYIAAAVLFILSLGGLSGQESAKRAVWYGIVGMGLAVLATVFGPGVGNWFIILLMIAGGSVLGYYVASRVQMTEMPQLVAALHSFVGLAAVFIGYNAELELIRAYYRLGERPRRRLLDLAKALKDDAKRAKDRARQVTAKADMAAASLSAQKASKQATMVRQASSTARQLS